MSCVSSPTATQYDQFTSEIVSTSFSESVGTSLGSVTTIVSSICVPTTSGNVSTTICSSTQIISTLAPSVFTTDIPVVVTDIITTSTPTATLYGSSCRNDGGQGTPNPPSSPPTSPTPTPTPTPTPSSKVFSSSSTMPNGSVTIVRQTSIVVVTPSPSASAVGAVAKSSVNIGAIVGGVVGGIAGLAVLIFVVRFLFFRKKPPFSGDDMDDLDAFYENKHLSKPGKLGKGGAGIDEPAASQYSGNPPVSSGPASSNGVSGPGSYSYNAGANAPTSTGGVGSSTGVPGPHSDVSSLARGPSSGGMTTMSGSTVYSPNAPTPMSQPMTGVGSGAHLQPGHFSPNAVAYGPLAANAMIPMAAAVDPNMHRRGPSVGSGDGSVDPRTSYYSGPGVAPLSSEGGSTLSSGGSFSANSRVPLTVANPTPLPASAYPQDVKDRTVFLNDSGYQVRGGQSAGGPSQAGGSGPVIQHQDAGAIAHPRPDSQPEQLPTHPSPPPQQEQPGPSARRPFVHSDNDFDEHLAGAAPAPRPRKSAEAAQDQEREPEAPPPAYQE